MPFDVDRLIADNARYASEEHDATAAKVPTRKVVVVTCMDARLDPLAAFGLVPGEAHVLRNAGGAVTDDVLRSILVSQRALGTEHVVIVKHTGCGMIGLDERAFLAAVEEDHGAAPAFDLHGIADLDAQVRADVASVRDAAWLIGDVSGFVWDVESGALRPVLA